MDLRSRIQGLVFVKSVRLSPKLIHERSSELIEVARVWLEEGFDGVSFDRCFCGMDCGTFSSYHMLCGHSDVEGHFRKVYNDLCKKCKEKYDLERG